MEQRRIPIRDADNLVAHPARVDMPGPPNHCRNAHSAFVERVFLSAQRSVARSASQQAAIVAGENYDGVLADTALIERRQDTTNGIVHRRDGCGEPPAGRLADRRVAGQVLSRRLYGAVWRVEWDVKEQRAGRIAVHDPSNGLLGDEVGRVAFLTQYLVVAVPVEEVLAIAILVGPVVDGALILPVLVREAPVGGQIGRIGVSQVPL